MYLDSGLRTRPQVEELLAWEAKVRPGGILAGHDFSCLPEVVGSTIVGYEECPIIHAVNIARAGLDVHLGTDKVFWWYKEAEEAEGKKLEESGD